jgi:transposase-like protein
MSPKTEGSDGLASPSSVWNSVICTVALAVTGASGETAGMRTRRPRPAPDARSAFAGFRFPPDGIVLAVRWYLRLGLSYRDLEERLTERGVEVNHVTVYRWVVRLAPLLAEAARPCRHAVGDRWQVDETYVKVAGRWQYLYRGLGQFGQVIDVVVSPRRDARAAHQFFERALSTTRIRPVEVTTDLSRGPRWPTASGLASHRPVRQQRRRGRSRQAESAAATDARAAA